MTAENTNLSNLWHYFWSKVDSDDEHSDDEIGRLKLLASIGYRNANTALKKLGKSDDTCEAGGDISEMSKYDLDEGNKEIDPGAIPDFATLGEAYPWMYKWEVEEGGAFSEDYARSSTSAERSCSVSSEEEEGDTMADVHSLPFIYGGPEVENCEGWERLALLPDPWAEERTPCVSVITPDDLKEEDINPKLNVVTLSSGLSNFSLTPDKEGYGYTKLQLPSKGLTGIDILRFYPHLQYVDLSNNRIADLSPLWEISHLVVLDLSNNGLVDSSIEKPNLIWFLTYLNLSYNGFTHIPDFSNCWAIKHLDLSHNKIKVISVINKLRYLSYLNLSFNDLEAVENLSNKLLKEVNFSHNHIKCWQKPGPNAIHSLETIDVSNNKLTTLTIFEDMYNLTTLDVSYNDISQMSEFDVLRTLPVVADLKIAGNQLNTIIPDSKRLIMYLIPSLTTLDGVPVSSMERVSAVSLYGDSHLQKHLCQTSSNFFYRHSMNPTCGWERPKETGEHPAFIILIGDIGSSRKIIIDMVVRMDPHICKEVKMITSRPKVEDEITNSRMKYVSLEKFNEIEKQGGFLAVEWRLGHKYGVAVGELEDKHRVLLSFLGIAAALEVRWKGFNPTLIMVLPNKEEVLKQRSYFWFKSSDVYRTKVKLGKEESGAPRKSSGMDKFFLTGGDTEGIMFKSSRESQVPKMHKKMKAKWKKLNRMFSTVNKKAFQKDKRKLRHHPEDKFQKKKLLDEVYGGLLTTGAKGKLERDWCNIKRTLKLPTRTGSVPNDIYISPFSHQIRRRKSSTTSTSEINELGRFIKNIFRLQMGYRDMHIKNPGLFQLFVSSDEIKHAAKAIFNVVKKLYKKLEASKKVKTVDMEHDPNYESMVKEPIAKLVDEITAYDFPLDIVN